MKKSSLNKSPSEPIVIVTGVSGAGKSQALKVFEDFGYFCIDNLPTLLVPKFLDLFEEPYQMTVPNRRIALGLDIRAKGFVEDFPKVIEEFHLRGFQLKTLFLDSSEEVLLRRFSETRHRHPLTGKALLDAIHTERNYLAPVKDKADKVIDTSNLTLGELKEAISSFLAVTQTREMSLAVVSFGYKYGLPIDADLIWDVRFLPNPNYIAALKHLNGTQEAVDRYVMSHPQAKAFIEKLWKLLKELLPSYIREGKSYLTLGIGCTGGQHRSVVIAHQISVRLKRAGYSAREFHRDLDRK